MVRYVPVPAIHKGGAERVQGKIRIKVFNIFLEGIYQFTGRHSQCCQEANKGKSILKLSEIAGLSLRNIFISNQNSNIYNFTMGLCVEDLGVAPSYYSFKVIRMLAGYFSTSPSGELNPKSVKDLYTITLVGLADPISRTEFIGM